MIKTQKINNAVYIGVIAPLIEKFFNRINKTGILHGISYETLYTYFTRIAQYGGNASEFWVAFEDNKPVGFASWRVMDVPHYGKVYCDYMFSLSNNKAVATELTKEYVNFGTKHKASFYMWDAINPTVAKVLKGIANRGGLEVKDTLVVNMIASKKKEVANEDTHKDTD